MVALAILGVSLVALFQLFSLTLRSTRKADDYTKALIYARSMLDEAYSAPDPAETESLKFVNPFKATKEVVLRFSSEDEKVNLYEIRVTVTWPPSGSVSLHGLRTVSETEKQ